MILTRTNLIARILALVRDNIRGDISASKLRAVLTDVTDSFPNLLSDRIGLPMLAEDVLAVLGGGLDPAKFQGTWEPGTNTPTIPAASGPNTGNWYLAASAGTATGNAAGTYANGDRVRSNGTIWVRMPAPPTIIADGAVVWEKLSADIRDLMAPTFSPEFVYALVDMNSKVALGVRPDGTLFGRWSIDDGSVTTPKIADAAVTLAKLASSVTTAMASEMPTTFAGGYELTYAIVDTGGRVAFGVRADGTLLGKLPIDDGSITTAKLATAAVTRAKLEADLASAIPETMDRSDYVYVMLDSQDRIAFAIRADGTLEGKLTLIDGSVTRAKLAQTVAEVIPEDMSNLTGFLYAIVDSIGRIGFGIRNDGSLVGRFTPASATVTKATLAPALAREIIPTTGDLVVADNDDNGWRGRTFDIPAKTQLEGSLFSPFSSTPTRSLRGINTTGTTLEFRRSAGLIVRGKQYRGTWDATSGTPDASPDAGDWWKVTVPGTFAGISWLVGDRLVALGTVGGHGAQWVKGLDGETNYLGEFIPASHSPTGILNGDLWQASTSGTFSGLTFANGDLLLREAGVWVRIPTETIQSVANGAGYAFTVRNAREIEVRRADKSATQVGILAKGHRALKLRRSRDEVVMWGDSMVSTGGLNTEIASLLTPRTFTALSYPGCTSNEILSMMQKEVRGADAYEGRVHALFHGTNNLLDDAQVRAAAFAMADLAGARDNRLVFMTVIGQLVMQWTGARLACDQHEQAFAGTNAISGLENWYAVAFPGQVLNCRAALLAAAASLTTPSLQFPGMTEGAVATTYGVLPLSYHFTFPGPWTPATVTFAGYRSAAGLPSGGSDGQYWLRTANGTIGAIIVRWGGVWTEHTWDATHLSAAGNAALALAFANYLTANSL